MIIITDTTACKTKVVSDYGDDITDQFGTVKVVHSPGRKPVIYTESVSKCVIKKSITHDEQVEQLAQDLHEAGRAAVEAGNTVAAAKFGEQTRKFLGWDEINNEAKEGRRMQARWLLERYHLIKVTE